MILPHMKIRLNGRELPDPPGNHWPSTYYALWDTVGWKMIHQLNSSNKNKKNSWIFLVRGTFNNQLHTVVDPAPDLTQTMCLWQNFNKVLLHFVLFNSDVCRVFSRRPEKSQLFHPKRNACSCSYNFYYIQSA